MKMLSDIEIKRLRDREEEEARDREEEAVSILYIYRKGLGTITGGNQSYPMEH